MKKKIIREREKKRSFQEAKILVIKNNYLGVHGFLFMRETQ
jgi:hypothetical protein